MPDPALHSFAYALAYLRDQVADIPPPRMTEQPPGFANHAAWTIGHLIYTCQVFGGVFGLAPWLGEDWNRRYWTGSVPLADAEMYETKEELLAALADAQGRLTRAIESCDPARLEGPFPDPAYLEIFPTIRHSLVQVLVGHTSYHIGQVGAWRRALGLPPMQRPFD